MDSVKGYLISVICGSILCAIVGTLTDAKGTNGTMIKLISGIFLVFTVVSPFASLKIEELSILTGNLQEDAADAVAVGQTVTAESLDAIIKAELEAYILDKATVLGAELTAEIILDGNHKPISVRLQGKVAPYTQYRLESIIEKDLGIAKENQQWIA